MVKVGKGLPEQIARARPTLEERRLWTGSVAEVGKVVWGAPGRTWTAVRERRLEDQRTGPGRIQQSPLPVARWGIRNFQKLEYSSLLPQAVAAGKESYLVEFLGLGDKPIFRLEEVGTNGVHRVNCPHQSERLWARPSSPGRTSSGGSKKWTASASHRPTR